MDEAYRCCLEAGARVHFPPEEDREIPGYFELFSSQELSRFTHAQPRE